MKKYKTLLEKENKSDVSKATGISRQALYDWINGKYEPNYKQIVKLSLYFNKAVEELI